MKTLHLSLITAAVAFFIGCGGGGGGSDNGATDGSASSSGTPVTQATFTLNSADDIRGYTIATNKAEHSLSGMNWYQKITVAFQCDGTIDYTITTGGDYATNVDRANGDNYYVAQHSNANALFWDYTFYEGGLADESNPSGTEYLGLNSANQIVIGATCWNDFGGEESGENCANGLYIESITQDELCSESTSTSSSEEASSSSESSGSSTSSSGNQVPQNGTWYLKYTTTAPSPYIGGSVVFKNFSYECEGYSTPVYGKTCSEVYTDDADTSITYSGNLAYDPDLTPLYIFENGLQLSVLYPYLDGERVDWQGGVDLNQLVGSSTAMGDGCVGVWSDSYSQNLQNGTAFTISMNGPGGTSCSLEFKPCTEELCQ